MTLIELLFFIANCTVGYFAGRYLGGSFGMIGWIVGVPSGFFLGIGVIKVSILLLDNAWYSFHPLRPMCRKGKCKSKDYTIVKAASEGSTFSCRCGDKYFRDKNSERFFEVLPTGALRSYMNRKPVGHWLPDDQEPLQINVYALSAK